MAKKKQGELQFTEHAKKMLAEREILLVWVHKALDTPIRTHPDPSDSDLTHCPISDNGTGLCGWYTMDMFGRSEL